MTDTDQKQVVDYGSESKKLEEAQNRPAFWKPDAGKHEVICLSEMDFYEYKDEDDKVQKRAKLTVEIDGQQLTWSFGIGQTEASLYGQLVAYAQKHNNKLIGNKITLVVKSDGKKRDFTIV